ncbi:LuxR C-terminal-related transcriptional regulator [Dermacoccaceae bacterium W4C1]
MTTAATSSSEDEIPHPRRVLLVEDHPVVLRGLQAVLDAETDLAVVGTAGTSADAVRAAQQLTPDVVVLPWRLGGRFVAVELTRALKAIGAMNIVVYTGFDHDADTSPVLAEGAVVVPKTADAHHVVDAVRGERATPHAPGGQARLTEREQQVLTQVVAGLSNAEIAEVLVVEVTTVKTHVRAVLRKLGVASRRDLIGHPGRIGR